MGQAKLTRAVQRLTAPEVRNAKKPGLLHDGGGLYVQITATAEKPDEPRSVTKAWLLRYTAASGKRREMGLGAFPGVSLSDARLAAERARKLLQAGVDPIEARKRERAAAAVEAAQAMTFRQASEAYMKGQAGRWKSEKHAKLWASSLEAYAHPLIGSLPVADIDVRLVLKVLEPIWTEKTETASRVRQRIEAVLDWAAVRGNRQGDNPARWRGHLQKVLPSRTELRPVKHHAALPYAHVGAFMRDLRKVESQGALALELCILTATRTTETLAACWSEFDLDAKLWTIPAARMKGTAETRRDHRVPLSGQAVAVLTKLRTGADRRAKYVFPGLGTKRPMSGMAMLMTLRRMKRKGLTVHGFRSTFRDWCADCTNFPREIAEQALAHSLGDKTEAAYRRGDALLKRAKLMQAWADFCDRESKLGTVVPMQRKAADARGERG
jgi:integrase